MHRVERSYGKFTRSFALPSDADPSKVTASVDRGVVVVTIPKMAPKAGETPRVHDIPVQMSAQHTGGTARR
eukprot:m.277311 g.277311  ORF g.277311 m.277311 type:complete len:71 (+) comp57296_c0_seq1:2-214(+)